MTPRLVLRPQAEAELLDARDWYEEQRPGLGEAFATEVDLTLAQVVQAPRVFPKVATATVISGSFWFMIIAAKSHSEPMGIRVEARKLKANRAG